MDYYTRKQEIANEIWKVVEANPLTTREKVEVFIQHIIAKYGCGQKMARELVEANIKSGHLKVVE